jgi:hypothetical protein
LWGGYPQLLEADAAEHRSTLSGLKRNGGFFAAVRAFGSGFGAYPRSSPDTLGLARLAALGIVLKLFIVEEELFTGGEDEFRAAVNTL